MAERGACPICAKVAEDRHALVAHLEYSHHITDGDTFLDEGQGRSRVPWWTRVAAARVAVVVGLALVVGAMAVGAVALLAGSDVAPLSSAASPDAAEPAVTTTAPAGGEVTPASAAPAAAPDDVTTTSAPQQPAATTSTTAPPSAVATFRKPFVVDSRTGSCTPVAESDRYELVVTLSGAVDIVLEGRYYPGRSGDGERTIVRDMPAETVGYVDEIRVDDAAGTSYRVPVTPPLYLPGC